VDHLADWRVALAEAMLGRKGKKGHHSGDDHLVDCSMSIINLGNV
jgi:hypothetical protein